MKVRDQQNTGNAEDTALGIASPTSEPDENTSLIESGYRYLEISSSEKRNEKNSQDDISKASNNNGDDDDVTTWIRLLIFFIASVIAGGIIPGQNVYNRLFCEAGLFRYACHDDNTGYSTRETDPTFSSACCHAQWLIIANVMNVLSVLVIVLFLFSGLLFDIIGGRRAAVVGSFFLLSGILIIATLIHTLTSTDATDSELRNISSQTETTIFVVGVVLADIGSLCANVGFFGFLWHLPHHQAFVLSLSNSCFSCAAFIPLVLAGLIERYELSLTRALIIYAGAITVSGITFWLTVPDINEYRSRALKVLGLPIPKRAIKGVKGVLKELRNGFRILPRHARLHVISILVFVLAWVPPFIYMSMSDPLGQEVFQNEEDGHKMGDLFVKTNTIIGLIVGPTCAVFIDNARHASEGLIEVAVLLSLSMAVLSCFCPIPLWNVQLVDVSLACATQTIVMLFATRYAVIFAPPQRVGTFTGLIVACFGLISLLPILLVSLGIAISGSYVRPVIITSAIGAGAWSIYAFYLKRNKPFPNFPVLLPEDEKEIAKTFSVATIEEAAFVAGMEPDAFLKLSTSSKVADLRRLSDAALNRNAAERVLHVARRRSSLISIEPAYSKSDYQIPTHTPDVVFGEADTSIETLTISFNGHGGFGGKNEPGVEWIMESLGPRETKTRIEAIHSFLSPNLTCAEMYGLLLEIKDTDKYGKAMTGAVCACYPPGGLEPDGSTMSPKNNRWFYALATADVVPTFLNRNVAGGHQMLQRLTAFKQDSKWEDRRVEYGEMWYVAVLGTHPLCQGRGFARQLLDVVAHWAKKTGHDCYLECSLQNVPFYKKCDYSAVWEETITVEGSSTTMVGMARKSA